MKASLSKSVYFFLSALILSSCGSDGEEPVIPTTPPASAKIPITLSFDISAATRATDSGYESGDKIGLYVVNYNGNNPGTLTQSGNHADNVCFTYSGTWASASPIYWENGTTPADFYCYYPYGTPANITAHEFNTKANQSTTAAYKQSEFLYGKASKVSPTEKAVSITTDHLFSCAIIKVAAGNGFTEESLAAANVSVKLNGCKTKASINLKNGAVTATGETTAIVPLKEDKNFKALIVPQTVNADNFITVTVDSRDFNLPKNFTFVGGKRHTFTVTVNKTSNGVNVGIGSWDDDGTDHGGTAE